MAREYQLLSPQGMVDQFHSAFGCVDDFNYALRRRLINEEFEEVEEAFDLVHDFRSGKLIAERRAHLLKELCDLVYVAVGAASNLGMNFDEAFRRVHESNMSKLGADGKPLRREDGKVVKGPNYREPDLEDLV